MKLGATGILLVVAKVLATVAYTAEDEQQRRTFLETRQSLEVKLVIEEQSAEQERLLLSVLPEHVAVQMRKDLDQADSQFKKIYMSRHENVSILYADIVGFTAISSTYSAQELVKMLNELFARFDKLAEKYQQLRIKILGDCYYCISGAPIERPDHAVLCVHMGLSMVKAIKYVQQTANSPVDMRVGIHTGAVLAGVLGQRQWQFDVYSKDVELANKMESAGLPGRVHISATTLSFLNGEFEVEPGYGEKRDEVLRIAGLKTYFIVKVLKPFEQPHKVQNGDTTITADANSDEFAQTKAPVAPENSMTRAREDSEQFTSRLMKELVNRDGFKELAKNTNCFTLNFKDKAKERAYYSQVDGGATVPVYMLMVVSAVIMISLFTIAPSLITENIKTIIILYTFLVLWVLVIVLVRCFHVRCIWMEPIVFYKAYLVVPVFTFICMLSIVVSRACQPLETWNKPICQPQVEISVSCMFPFYIGDFGALILIAGALPHYVSYTFKAFLLAMGAACQCFLNFYCLQDVLDILPPANSWSILSTPKYSLSCVTIGVTISLIYLGRHMNKVQRVLFLWRCEVKEQRRCAEDLKRRNEALVYNILPSHVAAHFMGNRNRNHDELYSQSYEEVGVLFASMPNFSDFYSEETVNNQGLECLRFLNEVISDFDALLELPQYCDIIKIKTIGSTYMAASGLNPSRLIQPKDPIEIRWAHLSLLVEFALDLKKALQSINEQSFNHFVLKMGINHGPITAGVIGARKPHYDIWGNTVNVASRMESTGKAGCIQVTEETCQILRTFNYQFEQRGLVAVKGKGQLMTYYLQSCSERATPPTTPASPVGGTTMETVDEEEESSPAVSSRSDEAAERSVIECPLKVEADDICIQEKDQAEIKDSNEATLLLSSCKD
ncbi:hypothetical protein HUJ05_005330 [Dendroctonus ponderosae]|nr:hypothetical protein HUJ05_005330 [Dendroctonus ponderosae]